MSDSIIIATASHDLTGRITRLNLVEGEEPAVEYISSLHLHTGSLSSISADSTGSKLLTSSWDSLIGLWDTTVPTKDEVPVAKQSSDGARKKRKVESAARGKRKAPITVLKSHTGRVSQATWNGADSAVSCGFDSTVRAWDTETGICTETIVSL
jgi:ribosome biogenesis protein